MVVIGRIGDKLVIVIMRIRGQVVDMGPVRTGVVGAEDSTERRGRRVGDAAIHGDHRIYGRWVLRRYGNACATDVAGWQSVGECGIGKSGPCPSAVHRLVDPASHAGSLHVRPALSYAVPHRCVEYLGI